MAYPQHNRDVQPAPTARETGITIPGAGPADAAANPFARLHKLDRSERGRVLAELVGLDAAERGSLDAGLSADQADTMIENVVGRYALPLAVAANFLVNGRDVAIPMVLEEPSVVAGISYAAKLARAGGGFLTSSSESIMIGQIQVMDLVDIDDAVKKVLAAQSQLLDAANRHHPTIQKLGGGAKGIECRPLRETLAGPMLIVHILYDCCDAMGANAVNTAAEAVGPLIESITGGRVNLKILSNLTDRRTARAECLVPVDLLAKNGMRGDEVARSIFEASAFAAADPYRAATHNKGIMNGIDAVAIATGNDWRALEAGAHAYAARDGRYTSLSLWSLVKSDHRDLKCGQGHERPLPDTSSRDRGPIACLHGVLEMPMSVGTVGGATRVHPTARAAMKILGQPHARQLAEILAAVGLAQNFAAIRALACEGLQRGHMRMHARQVAMAAGATAAQILQISERMVDEGVIRVERAREFMSEQ
ncbi:hydroxymethylglutaryl-CoA reductase, degradative [uncultured Bradyrhizobium sp.]|uniref:hydroxymethylglutaryl-CoA reductase, degradative n=1 Tax=uncultured Bradyrhizobium sp. TaxID=199684 RepID=UPI0035CB5C07